MAIFDAFQQTQPTEIDLIVRLRRTVTRDEGGNPSVSYAIDASIEIVGADGTLVQARKGNIENHLDAQTKAQLKTFIDNLYQEAKTQIIGN